MASPWPDGTANPQQSCEVRPSVTAPLRRAGRPGRPTRLPRAVLGPVPRARGASSQRSRLAHPTGCAHPSGREARTRRLTRSWIHTHRGDEEYWSTEKRGCSTCAMAPNIKNPEVERLAAEVAALTGKTNTEAVGRALGERRTRLRLRISEAGRRKRWNLGGRVGVDIFADISTPAPRAPPYVAARARRRRAGAYRRRGHTYCSSAGGATGSRGGKRGAGLSGHGVRLGAGGAGGIPGGEGAATRVGAGARSRARPPGGCRCWEHRDGKRGWGRFLTGRV